jgi:hypothetical protein
VDDIFNVSEEDNNVSDDTLLLNDNRRLNVMKFIIITQSLHIFVKFFLNWELVKVIIIISYFLLFLFFFFLCFYFFFHQSLLLLFKYVKNGWTKVTCIIGFYLIFYFKRRFIYIHLMFCYFVKTNETLFQTFI